MVYIFLATGFEEVEAITVVDLLRRADIQIKTVSIMGDKDVFGSRGIGVKADALFEKLEFDNGTMVVLPGGMPGTTNLLNYEPLCELLKKYNDSNKAVAAICAAPMVLGELGILTGHEATIYEGMEEHLKGATHKSDNVVVSDNIITSKGPGTAMDFALSIITYIKGADVSQKIKKELLYK